MTSAISIKGISKQFIIPKSAKSKSNSTHKTVIDNIDLEIKKGDIVGIIGENGSGKSTLGGVGLYKWD